MPRMSSSAPELLPALTPFKNKTKPKARNPPGAGCPPAACRWLARWRRRLLRKMAPLAPAAISGAKPPAVPRSDPTLTAGAPLGPSYRRSALTALICPPAPTRERRETPGPTEPGWFHRGRALRQPPRRWQGRLPCSLPVRVGRRGREAGSRGACGGGASVGGSESEGWVGRVWAVQPLGWGAGCCAPRHWGRLRVAEPSAAH